MRAVFLFPAFLMLSGCITDDLVFTDPKVAPDWVSPAGAELTVSDTDELKQWWKRYNDPTLNALVEMALTDSPDHNIAAARIAEARGLRRTSRSFLFPQINASAEGRREDTGIGGAAQPDNHYDAGFDASYELDIFGVNRKALSASDQELLAAQADFDHTDLTLAAEIVRTYIDFRAAQNQYMIAAKNTASQEKTLNLTRNMYDLGEAPLLDVTRADNLVNTTRASLSNFRRLENNARLGLSVLTGHMPDQLVEQLNNQAEIPGLDIAPVLLAPAQVIENRPDIKAAQSRFLAKTRLSESAVAELFPRFTLGAFYGVTDSSFVNATSIWNIAIGTAVNLIDFGRVEGRVDAARARETQAFELYRKTVISAVVEVETALNDYTQIHKQLASLDGAYRSAAKSLSLSETLYKEGEISFLNVLDAQRNANNAEAAVITARAALAESQSRLYKSLGVH